jgi:DNA polymerase III delta prime subunit
MLDTTEYDPHSPKSLDDIVGNTELWKALALQIKENKCTNLVLVGPSGCGKSLFLRLALSGFLTLIIDCTANFGLRDVRDSIRLFARGGRDRGNLRWIIFEHADALTADTQAYLRRMLETTHNTTRICFECSDAGAITEPILSRCTLRNVYAPDATEIRYELLRRTDRKISGDILDILSKESNLRSSLLRAFASVHFKENNLMRDANLIQEILSKKEGKDLLMWALEAEATCRNNGIDLRALLVAGWPHHHIVTQTLTLWSRLGGISGRSQFFACVAALHGIV